MHIPTSLFTSVLGWSSIMSQSAVVDESDVQVTLNPMYPSFPLKFRPVVIWHGLGDNYNSSSINKTVSVIKESHPDIFAHPIYVDVDPDEDERRTLFGDANKQIELVCQQLQEIPELARGFDAIGFSQGGLLLRGLVERCPEVSINNLITFGSPHMGISDILLCEDAKDWICKRRNALLKSQIWLDRIQQTLLPALYFRDLSQYDKYVFHSHFLADVNNELVDHFNLTYRKNLNSLNKLVMVKFNKDSTLVPKESAWFGELDPETGDVVDFDKTTLYVEDLIGLRELHFSGKLDFLDVDEDHMRIPQELLVMIIQRYIGGIVF